MAIAKIDTQELDELMAFHGLKNLDSFRVQSLLSKLKRRAEALISSDAAMAYNQLGIIYGYRTDYAEAVDCFQKSFALEADHSVSMNIARAHVLNGSIEQAAETYLSVLRANPSHQESIDRLYWLAGWYLYPELIESASTLYKGSLEHVEDKDLLLSAIQERMDFLNQHDVPIDVYRKQLIYAYSEYHKMFNTYNTAIMTRIDLSEQYISRVFNVDIENIDVEHIYQLNQKLDSKIESWLDEQSDGGFELANQLNHSVLYFSVA